MSTVLTIADLPSLGTTVFHAVARAMPTEEGARKVIKAFKKPKPLKPFEQDFLDLIEGRRAGHMGHYEYTNGGMKLWDKFLSEHPEYYIPSEDRSIIEGCARASANLLKMSNVDEVTLVSRGPGTKFDAKEGALVRAFQIAGIKISKVVYIDVSKSALKQSMAEGMAMLPNAKHEQVEADIFDPTTKSKYKVKGIEVGTCFGLTPMNAEGRHDGVAPISAIEANLTGIRGQMSVGSHFIATYDHNRDKKSIEEAYAGQAEFAKYMFKHYLGWDDVDDIDFVVEYNEESGILAHGFRFNKERSFALGDRERTIPSGKTFWFNNSVKLNPQDTVDCHTHSGFSYTAQPELAQNDRMAYHHVLAA